MNKKSEQLGMSISTAGYRLQRQILFNLLKELSRDNCYRCNEKIITIEEFSVDHKINWLNNDPNLFWDLNNIAFSHRKCNCAFTSTTKWNKAPVGKAWCYICKEYKNINLFTKNKSTRNGFASHCRVCKKYARELYKLSNYQVAKIREEVKTESLSFLSRKYNVNRVVIRRIRDGIDKRGLSSTR